MTRWPRRVIPAIAVAVLVLAACVATTVSLIQRLVGAHEFLSYDTVADHLHATTWHDLPVLLAGVVAAVLGIVLLAAALWPGRAVVVPLADEDAMSAGVRRRGLRSALRGTAGAVDGIGTERIRLRRNAITVSAHSDRIGTDGLPDALRETLTHRIGQIGPPPVHRVRATLRGPRTGHPS
ncbi:DUF6286 domain-containing protein [Nocardia sp. alder85J]|uniref:DUF6286 domain-containing protein n=1 Tax=Nocardia sp. alder85J TaxID=2862949 RepID=UPI001CD6B5EE|nr:DUF6286 domain-containing protein [Nocardia sp. alder85J]MCX4093582.1 DUF6286 domain-containing protein [Nocardia sp. alder85J]